MKGSFLNVFATGILAVCLMAFTAIDQPQQETTQQRQHIKQDTGKKKNDTMANQRLNHRNRVVDTTIPIPPFPDTPMMPVPVPDTIHKGMH
jgi:hypothetical protein